MTAAIFNKWLLEWDLELWKTRTKILLVIDNCPSHRVDIDLKSIEILFLPANLTATLQPLDQGVIKCFKSIFTNKKLSDIIEKVESGCNVFDSYKKLTIKDAVVWISFARHEITTSKIANCFKHANWYWETKDIEINDQYEVDVFDEFILKTNILDPIDEKSLTSWILMKQT